MSRSSFRNPVRTAFLILLVGGLVGGLAGCSSSGDPAGPGDGTWVEEALPSGLGGTGLLAIDAHGGFAVAVGARIDGPGFVPVILERTPSGWRELALTGLPGGTILTDVVVTGDNQFVLVGGTGEGVPVVVDMRHRIHIQTFPTASTAALRSVAAGDGVVRAVGFGSRGFAVVSTAPGNWTVDPLPFTVGGEKGFDDLHYQGGRFFACGFDDGGEPYRLVLVHDGTAWSPVAVPGVNRDLNAVLGNDAGGFLVGGQYYLEDLDVAFLLGHSPDPFDWFEIVLPEPSTLASVNDIFRNADGSLWLACGGGGTGGIVENGVMTHTLAGRLLGLAEAGDGSIYAAGVTGSDASPEPIILRRR